MLTLEAFKLALISSRNEKKYRNYYLLLEKIFKYYNYYQNEHLIHIIKKQNIKYESNVTKLLDYGKSANEKLDKLQITTDGLFKLLSNFINGSALKRSH